MTGQLGSVTGIFGEYHFVTEERRVKMLIYQFRHIVLFVCARNGVDDEYDTLFFVHSFANLQKKRKLAYGNKRNLMNLIKYLDFCSLFHKKCVTLQSETKK